MPWEPSHELRELNALYKELDQLYHKLASRMGLSDSAFFILYSMAELGDRCLQKDISEAYSISRKTINSSIKNLQMHGYLTLEKGNRRDMHIHLTEAGQQFMEENIVPVLEMENSIFEEFSKEESRQFLAFNRKYVRLFQQKAEEKFHVSSED